MLRKSLFVLVGCSALALLGCGDDDGGNNLNQNQNNANQNTNQNQNGNNNNNNSLCGNGTLDSGETCDDGANNGSYGYCLSDCSGDGKV